MNDFIIDVTRYGDTWRRYVDLRHLPPERPKVEYLEPDRTTWDDKTDVVLQYAEYGNLCESHHLTINNAIEDAWWGWENGEFHPRAVLMVGKVILDMDALHQEIYRVADSNINAEESEEA